MKIQCDVCEKQEATVFCGADEAALCENCDERVHHANKLASKHQRFSLLNPSFKETPPQCDICQDRRAVVFCKEDRAILCRECDIPIHKANEHTKKHNRFLLTGVKLSSSSAIYRPSSSSSNDQSEKMSSSSDVKIANRGYAAAASCGKFKDNMNMMPSNGGGVTTPTYCQTSEEGSISTSDYMMDSDGGWRLEDLIDASSSGSQFFSKTFDYEMPTAEHWYHNEIVQNNNMGSFPSQDLKMWTTQGLTPDYPIFLPTM